jgi:hypothetical protein
VQEDHGRSHARDVSEETANRVEEAEASLGGLTRIELDRDRRRLVLVPEPVTATATPEVAQVDARRHRHVAEEAQGAIDDGGEGTEGATWVAAPFEDHSAIEPRATRELVEQT